MTGKFLNQILEIKAKHALFRKDGLWYHNLKDFPGVLFDKDGYAIFKTREDYSNEPLLQIKKDLHIKEGIQSLPNYKLYDTAELTLINGIDQLFIDQNEPEETLRVLRNINVILRKRNLVEKIKKLYNNSCQICGLSLIINKGQKYSEVHHITPLGRPHNGKDNIANMICVCPNCHVLLDFRVIKLLESELIAIKHEISKVNFEYHNSLVL